MLDVTKYGAKAVNLDYIKQSIPNAPILPYVLVGVDESWKAREKEILSLGENILVRSSSPFEDGAEVSFAGLFDSVLASKSIHSTLEGAVERVKDSVNDSNTNRYAAIHGITEPLTMALVFQKRHPDNASWSMVRHPHLHNVMFISRQYKEDASSSWVYEQDKGIAYPQEATEEEIKLKDISQDLERALDFYYSVESLPRYQMGYTYQMEFGVSPFSFFQFRPFRKKEEANWECSSTNISKGEKYQHFTFGITPKEGIELKTIRMIDFFSSPSLDQGLKGKKDREEVLKIVREAMGLNTEEEIYAQTLFSQLKPGVVSSAYHLHEAVEELHQRYSNESTAVLSGSLHHHAQIDILFPSSKVWIPSYVGSSNFMAHNCFRAIQHYPISLMGYLCRNKTGDKVRVFSDGINARIEYL